MESMSTLLDTLAFKKYYTGHLQLQKDSRAASKSESSEEEKNENDYEHDEHENEDRDEYGKNGEEDDGELESVKEERNTQCCPGCGATVGRRFDRSINLLCWCQCEFCYKCGERWNEDHFETCEESSSDEVEE